MLEEVHDGGTLHHDLVTTRAREAARSRDADEGRDHRSSGRRSASTSRSLRSRLSEILALKATPLGQTSGPYSSGEY